MLYTQGKACTEPPVHDWERYKQLARRLRGQDNATSGLAYLWYAASQKVHKDEEEKIQKQMEGKGFIAITADNWKDLDTLVGKKVVIRKKGEGILDGGIDKVCRCIKDAAGTIFFMPPRCRRRGYFASSLIGAFYKIA